MKPVIILILVAVLVGAFLTLPEMRFVKGDRSGGGRSSSALYEQGVASVHSATLLSVYRTETFVMTHEGDVRVISVLLSSPGRTSARALGVSMDVWLVCGGYTTGRVTAIWSIAGREAWYSAAVPRGAHVYTGQDCELRLEPNVGIANIYWAHPLLAKWPDLNAAMKVTR